MELSWFLESNDTICPEMGKTAVGKEVGTGAEMEVYMACSRNRVIRWRMHIEM